MAAAKKPGAKPRAKPRKKQAPASKGLSPQEAGQPKEDGQALAALITQDGGHPLSIYRDPMGGHSVVLAALPLEKVEPTPFQRDRSEPHVKRLTNAMERVGRYLDPIIAVRKDGKYWTPNGNHRLGALGLLGQKTIVALVLPDENVAYQILALNTEKAHNLKERSLEVIRMLRGLTTAGVGKELDYVGILEEPHFATFGAAYEKRPRFSAGAYSSVVKRLEQFHDLPLAKALELREKRADLLLQWDDEVAKVVDALKSKGLVSPYLKYFVIGRVNFLRFKKDGDFDFDDTINKLIASTKKIDAEKVNKEDVAKSGGGPVEASDE